MNIAATGYVATSIMIDAELTYRLTRCPLYGFEALHPNGFYTTHVRVLNFMKRKKTVIFVTTIRWFLSYSIKSIPKIFLHISINLLDVPEITICPS
ncbi:ISL3 family transposase [Lactiplantibacillus plantarum]|nr:ISL3 family transposase [Lactiplantibacillus plantarum]